MQFVPLELDGAWLIELERHEDQRGSFARTFCEREFAAHGLPTRFPQASISVNGRAGTLRGMHTNTEAHWEAKVVRCTRGSIYDVIVDLRDDSPSRYGWIGVELSVNNGTALFVPRGFAHGFLTLEDDTDVTYQMDGFFVAEAARGFRWDDRLFAIEWPEPPVVISERDADYPAFEPGLLEG